jgi:tetratricopeptide (TPR) repeat protein
MDEKSEARNIGVGISSGQVTVSGDIVGGDKNVYEAPVPVIAALYQLPPPPADFTGRETELRDLRAVIEKGGVHISGLQGQGGVGKTVLALSLAADLAPKFPDAQIYLDLKGVSQEPLTVAEALAYVVRAFHPEAKPPEKEDDLHALYHSVLRGKHVLLLMDNAKDAAQVKPLIPPEGCALIVTSRYRFTLPGLHQKILDTFPQEDATQLLLRVAPRIDGEAEAIAKLCGYLPLSVRLAASVLAVRVDIEPSDYRGQLAEEKNRLKLLATDEESVEACIALSYNLLSVEAQKRWRLLSVFPDTFDALAAAVVWGMETDAAKDTLSRLLQYSVLEWNNSSKRYRLHDLMRDFVRQRVEPLASTDAARRHATHYLAVLRSADDLYKTGGNGTIIGLGLLDLEWRNIQIGHAWAQTNAEEGGATAQLCSAYPDQGATVLLLRQHPQEQIHWRQAALNAARNLKDRATEGRHLGSLGTAYLQLSDYPHAIEYYELDRAIARELGDLRGEGQTLGNLGNASYASGDPRRAIGYHQQALTIARTFSDRLVECNALSNMGIAYVSQSQRHHCLWCVRDATQEVVQKQGNLTTICRCCDDPKCMGLSAAMCERTLGAA